MNRRILYIIFGAIAFIALVILLWVWLLGRGTPTPNTTGTFGTASSTQTTGGTGGTGGNISGNIAKDQTSGTSGGNLQPGSISGATTPGSGTSPGTTVFDTGAQWLYDSGSGGIARSGLGSSFNPKTVNQLNDGSISGTPTILGNTVVNSTSGSGIGLEGALIGAGLGTALCTAGLLGGVTAGGLGSLTGGVTITAADAVKSVPTVSVSGNTIASAQLATQGSQVYKANFLDCVTRTIAKAALQQITASIVNWINSGFNGSPSFVTNYQQFFQNVADVAAGEYIKGSGLSFLCSPFQTQIRVALAKSYANRNSGMSCSLSKVVKNINSFMSGNFSQGGWGGLLQFTTAPTNNPYGAFAYAQIGLQTAQSNAYQNANRNMTATGFLNMQQAYDCKPSATGGNATCKYKTVTPGSVIESSLASTLGTSQRTLEQAGISGSFDAIINALISQLMTKALYGGVSNLSGNSGYASTYLTPDQQQAQDQAQALMTAMQADVTVAQQYGNVAQGAISDIQNTQARIAEVRSCWEGWRNTPGLSASKVSTAVDRSEQASTTIAELDVQVDAYNAEILRANTAITALQALQTDALNVTSLAGVQALTTSYNSAKASGQIMTAADVTTAQQNRITLQAQLGAYNNAATAEMTQCNAFGN